jgi:hypothetical protein
MKIVARARLYIGREKAYFLFLPGSGAARTSSYADCRCARENVFITTKRFYFSAAAGVRGSPRGPAAAEKEEVRYLAAYINPSACHNFHSSEAASQA